MKKLVLTGKTVEDAVKAGLAKWNVPESRVRVHVLEQPSKGLFGLIGSRDAKVELELIPDPVEEAVHFLEDVVRAMGIKATISVKPESDHTLIELSGGDLGILIGKRGQTLDALQYLAGTVANRYSNTFVRIVLDAEHFRERRRKTLEELALKLAARVVRSRKDVVLEPMTSQERKTIHTVLQNHPQVKTYSKGDEPNRRIVITLK